MSNHSTLRRCSKCKSEKEDSEFYPSSRFWCKKCQKDKQKESYTPETWKKRWAKGTDKERRRNRARENYVRFFKHLENHPCIDCGESDIVVLQCDHLTDKKRNVSYYVGSGVTWNTIQKEIDKCEVVCSNCHDKRTHKRANTYKYQYAIYGEIKTFQTS